MRHVATILLIVGTICATILLTATSAASAAVAVQVVAPSVDIFPNTNVAGTVGANLVAARNEFASFQLQIAASGSAVSNVNVRLTGPLSDAAGARIAPANVTIYREGYVQVSQASDGETPRLGSYPDALIPAVDTLYHEHRAAFPITVPAGENRVAWVDVLVPQTAGAGTYHGSLSVTSSAGTVNVPISVQVLGFALPSTASFASSFDINTNHVCAAFGCDQGGASGWHMQALFAQLALDDRVSLAKPAAGGPWGGGLAYFNSYVKPLFDGTAGTQLAGATLTHVELYSWMADSTGMVGAFKRAADADGFTSRVSFHCDELGQNAALWNSCQSEWTKANGEWLTNGSQRAALPVDVDVTLRDIDWAESTGSYAPLLAAIGIDVPVINRIDDNPSGGYAWAVGDQTAAYDAYASSGHTVWTYTSNMSYGSTNPGDQYWNSAYWNGWAGYAIDEPSSEQIAVPWVAFLHHISGEYYFETVQKLTSAWSDQYSEGGNGDGTLFYPGIANCAGGAPACAAGAPSIGGTHNIPLESIRLKRIRNGRQDYEYLQRLAQNGRAAAARSIAASLFPHPYTTNVSAAAIEAARGQLVSANIALNDDTPPADTTPPADPAPPAHSTSPGDTTQPGDTSGGDAADASDGDQSALRDAGNGGSTATGASSTHTQQAAQVSSPAAPAVAPSHGTGSFLAAAVSHNSTASRTAKVYYCRHRRVTLLGSTTTHRIYGTRHRDVILALGTNVTIYGRGGNDVICGGPGNDVIHGKNGHDIIDGEGGNDRIYGAGGDDVLYGGPGRDRIYAGSGNDHLYGQAGADQLFGGAAHDVLVGGSGADRLAGQAGHNVYPRLDSRDRVVDRKVVVRTRRYRHREVSRRCLRLRAQSHRSKRVRAHYRTSCTSVRVVRRAVARTRRHAA